MRPLTLTLSPRGRGEFPVVDVYHQEIRPFPQGRGEFLLLML